jgi:hypothetical protein
MIFFSTGYGFETVEFGGCIFIVLKNSKMQKMDKFAVSKLKLFQNNTQWK